MEKMQGNGTGNRVIHMKSLNEILDEIEQREQAATPAPWPLDTVKTAIGCCHRIGMFPGPDHKPYNHACIYADGEYADNSHLTARGKVLLANAQFIAAARSEIPALVKALRIAIEAVGQNSASWVLDEIREALRESTL